MGSVLITKVVDHWSWWLISLADWELILSNFVRV